MKLISFFGRTPKTAFQLLQSSGEMEMDGERIPWLQQWINAGQFIEQEE
jgi:hypothetical protein